MNIATHFTIFVLCVAQATPRHVHGSSVRQKQTRSTRPDSALADREVRTIISAIVDAILDGDKRKRSDIPDEIESYDNEGPESQNREKAMTVEYDSPLHIDEDTDVESGSTSSWQSGSGYAFSGEDDVLDTDDGSGEAAFVRSGSEEGTSLAVDNSQADSKNLMKTSVIGLVRTSDSLRDHHEVRNEHDVEEGSGIGVESEDASGAKYKNSSSDESDGDQMSASGDMVTSTSDRNHNADKEPYKRSIASENERNSSIQKRSTPTEFEMPEMDIQQTHAILTNTTRVATLIEEAVSHQVQPYFPVAQSTHPLPDLRKTTTLTVDAVARSSDDLPKQQTMPSENHKYEILTNQREFDTNWNKAKKRSVMTFGPLISKRKDSANNAIANKNHAGLSEKEVIGDLETPGNYSFSEPFGFQSSSESAESDALAGAPHSNSSYAHYATQLRDIIPVADVADETERDEDTGSVDYEGSVESGSAVFLDASGGEVGESGSTAVLKNQSAKRVSIVRRIVLDIAKAALSTSKTDLAVALSRKQTDQRYADHFSSSTVDKRSDVQTSMTKRSDDETWVSRHEQNHHDVLELISAVVDQGYGDYLNELRDKRDLDEKLLQDELLHSTEDSLAQQTADRRSAIEREIKDFEGLADSLIQVEGLTADKHDTIAEKLEKDLLKHLKVKSKGSTVLTRSERNLLNDVELFSVAKKLEKAKKNIYSFADSHSRNSNAIRDHVAAVLSPILETLPLPDSEIEPIKRGLVHHLWMNIVSKSNLDKGSNNFDAQID